MTVLEVVAIVLFVAYILFWIIVLIKDEGSKGALITISEHLFAGLILYIIGFFLFGYPIVAIILTMCAFFLYCKFATPR